MVWLIVSAAVLAALLVGLYFVYLFAFHNDIKDDDIYHVPDTPQYQAQAERMRSAVRKMDAIEFEWVFTTARDGLTLAGRYYHTADGAPVQIQMHGYRGNAYRDFCGGFHLARKLGHNVLVVDQRAHGRSGGKTISFGIKEREDCAAWAEFAQTRFGTEVPIFLCGISMGAASVIMATQLPLPASVAGVLADCPYSAPGEIIRKVCRDMKLPGALAYPFVVLAALIYGRFAIWKSSAVEAIRHTKVPVLLIHGLEDKFVPAEMSIRIHEANRAMTTLELFPDAGHGLSYLLDGPRYEQAVRLFVQRCVSGQGT